MLILVAAILVLSGVGLGILFNDKFLQLTDYIYSKFFPISYSEKVKRLADAEVLYVINCLTHLLQDKYAVDLIYKEVNKCKTLQDLATLNDSALGKLENAIKSNSPEYIIHLRRFVYFSLILRENIQRTATVNFVITHPLDRSMLN